MKTRKLNRNIFTVVCLGLLILASCQSKTHHSQTLTDYSNRDKKEMKTLYFYPSTIRMVSKILGDEKGQALSEIQRARLFFSWTDDQSKLRQTFKSFKSGIQDEGFEMLMEMSSSGNKVDIYMLDGDTDDYILFVDGDQGSFVLEILGNLSTNAIREISQLDLNTLTDIFQDDSADLDKRLKEDTLEVKVEYNFP